MKPKCPYCGGRLKAVGYNCCKFLAIKCENCSREWSNEGGGEDENQSNGTDKACIPLFGDGFDL